MASQSGSSKTQAAGTSAAAPTTALAQAAAARREARRLALELAGQTLASAEAGGESAPNLAGTTDVLRKVVEAFTPSTRASGGPRVILDKAEPSDVLAFFDSTGLTRKELAAGAGVSPSVIATVQNPKGDRWSAKTFEAKKVAIAAWMTAHKAEIDARKANEATEAAAKQAAIDAKAQRAAARATATAAKATAKAAPKVAAAKAPTSAAKAKAPAAKAPAKKATASAPAAVAVQA